LLCRLRPPLGVQSFMADVLDSSNDVVSQAWSTPCAGVTARSGGERRSIKRIADLAPALVLVGHGPRLRDVQQLTDLATRLP
jgi:hypothetical protein